LVPTISVAGLALILGIDRFMSEARALTNLIGSGVATIVVSKWEKELDLQQMERGLRRDVEEELEEEAQLKHAAAKTAQKPA
jgi:aerobic C4-dicarboxylate transport protein